ncbi:MAG: thioredoxin family protein [Geminocystis sp.]|nr:thioredoxin family protein [Geminocystis sp.]HIK38586.1 thioredoxin family protein [Geminocystis sp. M7585_C2015_104]MCS7147325.1 thioredoxin family protein [Geminocystis sp.]MCX8078791.1 thioredoxin family protein [Geminocystis sp.]MDW8116324.1 thioredoxin family protein [Geminocystis sp.]
MVENNKETLPIQKLVIALVAVVLGVVLVISTKSTLKQESLETQAASSTPLEVALSNGKPSMIEFYAPWCTTCQMMAGDLASLKKEYEGKVNFVMLNVDNSNWLPEILKYDVNGIPHFVFLNFRGEAVGQAIGEQPLAVLKANLEALVASQPLPYNNSRGSTSGFNPQSQLQQGNRENPTNHGHPH